MRSNFLQRREPFAFTVEKHEFDNSDSTQLENLLTDIIKQLKNNYFHTFKYRSVYEMSFEQIIFGEVFSSLKTNDSKLFSSQIDRLQEKLIKTNKMDTYLKK